MQRSRRKGRNESQVEEKRNKKSFKNLRQIAVQRERQERDKEKQKLQYQICHQVLSKSSSPAQQCNESKWELSQKAPCKEYAASCRDSQTQLGLHRNIWLCTSGLHRLLCKSSSHHTTKPQKLSKCFPLQSNLKGKTHPTCKQLANTSVSSSKCSQSILSLCLCSLGAGRNIRSIHQTDHMGQTNMTAHGKCLRALIVLP